MSLFINRQVAWGISYKRISSTPADQDTKASLRKKWKARKLSELSSFLLVIEVLFQSLRYRCCQTIMESRKFKINPRCRRELIKTKLWSSQPEQKQIYRMTPRSGKDWGLEPLSRLQQKQSKHYPLRSPQRQSPEPTIRPLPTSNNRKR